ncbi:MAG: hypothetical protein N3D73_00600 [Candidatus Diapherotrites archaeon]|nr:hypothetical protein [Candidatus Diapherotrites archaeon]
MDNFEELKKKLLEKTKTEVKEKLSSDEINIIRAYSLTESIDATSNLLYEQLREWYSLYFPELTTLIKDQEIYLKLVYELCTKEKFTKEEITEFYKNTKKAEEIEKAAKNSIGSKIEEEALEEIRLLALNILNLKEEKKYLTKYIEKTTDRIMPNTSYILGNMLAAKMLLKAGSLKKLANMPASTIQILGADKAIFLHIKKKTKSPKYGIIYNSKLIMDAPRRQRGKVARILANNLAIALKVDYYTKRFIGEELKKRILKKIIKLK